jgi:ATP-dependent exoDNAse (exonuclease V) beta subunit
VNRNRHLVVRASAGTGKTYALTSRYLALLFAGTDPGSILATTFTRKAAHEILDRVLARLADAARDDAKRAELSGAVGRDVSADECLDLLARLLRGMERIRIATIDAFFAQLARLFALDVGLPPGWRIADESEGDALRAEAVADAVAGAGKLELLDLLRDLQRQRIGQSVHRELLEFARVGREALIESRREAWEKIEPLPPVEPAVLAAAVAALPLLPLPTSKSGKSAGMPKPYWAKCKERLIECAAREDWSGVLEIKLAEKVCAGETQYDRVTISPEHLEVLRPIVARALREATEQLALQNRASRALLERHEDSYQALARSRGLLDFSDLPEALAPVSGGMPGARARRSSSGDAGGSAAESAVAEREFDLEHRLDGRVDHLLLDEFQDTAPVQWRVLRPIADAILADASGEKSFYCVGDVKQSIYGWRAAEPRLLGDLAAKRPNLVEQTLKDSYRSSRAVLGTVNEVFAAIATNPAFTDEKGDERTEAAAAAAEFQRSFVKHESARRAGEEPPGAVFLLRAPIAKESEPEESPTLALTVERVLGILADAPLASVGILMRRRKYIPELIQRLREAGIAASDQGGNPLTDSAAVLHALSLLHLADHPGDLAAAFHVATSPIGARVGLTPEMFDQATAADPTPATTSLASERATSPKKKSSEPSAREDGGADGFDETRDASPDGLEHRSVETERREHALSFARARASAAARDVRKALSKSGFGGWLASIRPTEGDGYDAWDVGRFGQLVDLALAWEARAGSRSSAFVEHVRKTKVEDPSSAQVRVMTVHGAKGLEFDAVVLPELEGRLAQREDRLLTLRPDPEGEIEIVTHGLTKVVSAAHALLERVRADVAKRRMVEELCVLYVAMTRARHRLDLIVKEREKEGGGLTYAAILRGALRVAPNGENLIAVASPLTTSEFVAWQHDAGTIPWFPKQLGATSADAVREKSEGASAQAGSPVPTRASVQTRRSVQTRASVQAGTSGPNSPSAKATASPGVPESAKAAASAKVPTSPQVGASARADVSGEPSGSVEPRRGLRLAPSRRPRSLARLAPSNQHEIGLVSAASLLRPHDAMTVRGRLMHRLLQEVEWIETFERSDDELLAIGRRLHGDERFVRETVKEFRAALGRPETRKALSKPEGEVRVWRERPFTIVSGGAGGETMWSGAFDRVVVWLDGGRACKACVIDFKTDAVSGDALQERVESYRGQMGAYRSALATMTEVNPRDVEARLLFVSADCTVDL